MKFMEVRGRGGTLAEAQTGRAYIPCAARHTHM